MLVVEQPEAFAIFAALRCHASARHVSNGGISFVVIIIIKMSSQSDSPGTLVGLVLIRVVFIQLDPVR